MYVDPANRVEAYPIDQVEATVQIEAAWIFL